MMVRWFRYAPLIYYRRGYSTTNAANSGSGGYSPTTATEYTALIASRLSSAFDMVPQWLGVEYDVAAVFRERVEQTALLRDNVMDWSDTTEVVLLSVVDGAPDVKAALAGLRDITIASSTPSRHHRLTTVVRVLVLDEPSSWSSSIFLERSDKKMYRDDHVRDMVRRYRFSRSFRLGFWGWCTAAVVLVDLNSGEVVTNWAGRSRKEYFLPVTVH